MSNNDIQHISEQVNIYKKLLTSFSKTYYKYYIELPNFIYKNRMVQSDILNDLYEQSSQLQGLLREIIEDDINGETFRKLVTYSSSSPKNEQQQHQPKCPCPHCRKQDEEDGDEQYYEDDDEEEED